MITGAENGVFCVSNVEHGEIYYKSPEVGGSIESVCVGAEYINKIGFVFDWDI